MNTELLHKLLWHGFKVSPSSDDLYVQLYFLITAPWTEIEKDTPLNTILLESIQRCRESANEFLDKLEVRVHKDEPLFKGEEE